MMDLASECQAAVTVLETIAVLLFVSCHKVTSVTGFFFLYNMGFTISYVYTFSQFQNKTVLFYCIIYLNQHKTACFVTVYIISIISYIISNVQIFETESDCFLVTLLRYLQVDAKNIYCI